IWRASNYPGRLLPAAPLMLQSERIDFIRHARRRHDEIATNQQRQGLPRAVYLSRNSGLACDCPGLINVTVARAEGQRLA
ncbi:MAG: hypothetical protein OEV12_07970, partial [Gammaproteobacteria bacterium]|nr:hypothetical protein [Gammaproteobacteria bacterium]